ncbi:MAG TPA: DUF4265 domain-containing protein [Anaeromyxobacteraceae bacterium]|nr:DUF4265 domain-containing protein [Anaeromyxobacteraceae bacterium]
MDEAQREAGYVRIVVPLDRDPGDDGPDDEWVWAEPLGAGRYRIESTPFFAYGLSHGDVVCASDTTDLPRMSDVERKGGHRTLRVAVDPQWTIEHPDIRELLAGFADAGCSWESMPPQIIALDIPPDLDVERVVEVLQGPFDEGILIWEWADPRPC